MKSPDARQIAAYYDYTLPYYDRFWSGASRAIHYGFKDSSTRTHEDELVNTNRFLATAVGLRQNDEVLDVGCGVGGSSLWIAQQVGASVLGITLSRRQVQRARALAQHHRLEQRLRFEQADILTNSFANASFDVVWALESMCYLGHSVAFFREAARLLRPGGRIVIGDGFLLRAPRGDHERQLLDAFTTGLLLPSLTPIDEPRARLAATGFHDIEAWDKTASVRASARRLARRCRAGHVLASIGERLGLTPPMLTLNTRAGMVQHELVKRGIAGYAVYAARRL